MLFYDNITTSPILDPYKRIKIPKAIYKILFRYNSIEEFRYTNIQEMLVVLKNDMIHIIQPAFIITYFEWSNYFDISVTTQHINPYRHKRSKWLDSKRKDLILQKRRLYLGQCRVREFRGSKL